MSARSEWAASPAQKRLSAARDWATLRSVRVLLAILLVLGACDRATSPGTLTRATPANEATNGSSARSSASSAASSAIAQLTVPAHQIYQPSGLEPGQRRPLLIFLHGLGGSGKSAFDALHLAAFGERESVFVVAPDGNTDRQRRQFWNAGAACCNFDPQEVDDVARLARLLDTWRARPDVDSTRVYVMGFSNGGFMTERLVCALGDRITAAASMSGAAPPAEQACTPTRSLALLELRGDADEIVRYGGGSVFDTPGLSTFLGAEQGFRSWAKRLGCGGDALAAPDRDLDPRLPGSETRVERYTGCPGGSVELWSVRGGNHFVGMRQQAFSAVWEFLAAHHS